MDAENTRYDVLTVRKIERLANVLSDFPASIQSQYSSSQSFQNFARIAHKYLAPEFASRFLLKNFFVLETANVNGLDALALRVGVERVAKLSDGTLYRLSDDELRLLIRAKSRANVGDSSLASMRETIKIIFGDNVEIEDRQDMSLVLYVLPTVTRLQIWMLRNYGIAQRAAGVNVSIQYRGDQIFGFRGTNDASFNVGTFAERK